MPRSRGVLRQRTSNCQDRYFAVRLYIELKTVPRGGRRWRRWKAPTLADERGLGAAAEIEMPYLEDEKGASGWSVVEVRSRKNLPGNKRGYCLREHQAVPAVRTIPVVRTRVPEIPRFQLEFLHVEVEVESELSGRARCKVTGSVPLGWHCYCFWIMQLTSIAMLPFSVCLGINLIAINRSISFI